MLYASCHDFHARCLIIAYAYGCLLPDAICLLDATPPLLFFLPLRYAIFHTLRLRHVFDHERRHLPERHAAVFSIARYESSAMVVMLRARYARHTA